MRKNLIEFEKDKIVLNMHKIISLIFRLNLI